MDALVNHLASMPGQGTGMLAFIVLVIALVVAHGPHDDMPEDDDMAGW